MRQRVMIAMALSCKPALVTGHISNWKRRAGVFCSLAINATTRRHGLLALSIACALSLPLGVHAQSTTKSSKGTTREQQLEQRVNQLEQQLAELKAMIQEQKAATTQATQTAQQAQVAATQAQTTAQAKNLE